MHGSGDVSSVLPVVANGPTATENAQFDFSQLLEHPRLPGFDQGQESLLNWLHPPL